MAAPEDAVFATTHWTVVLSAQPGDSDAAHGALETLCRIYWAPLYAFLRRQGLSSADAEDLVQGFFVQFLARESLKTVSASRGRFRSFLLASLRHFLANHRRDQATQRRGGGALHFTLDDPDVRARCEAAAAWAVGPETTYDRIWAETVMERAAVRLRQEFVASDRTELYEGLRRWLAAEAAPGDYAKAAPALGLTEGALAVAVLRLRRRFREFIRGEVAQTVVAPEQVDEEMRQLFRALTE